MSKNKTSSESVTVIANPGCFRETSQRLEIEKLKERNEYLRATLKVASKAIHKELAYATLKFEDILLDAITKVDEAIAKLEVEE